jgi:hypothetical protein
VHRAARASNLQARSRKLCEGSAPLLTTVAIDKGTIPQRSWLSRKEAVCLAERGIFGGSNLEGDSAFPPGLHIREQDLIIGMYAG